MKTFSRIVAIALVVIMAFALFAITASAADSKSGTNISATVVTGKRPWYSLLNATITVKNTGSDPMNVYVLNSNGVQYAAVVGLKSGQSHTFYLKCNKTYSVYWCGNAVAGAISATGRLSPGRYITSIK